jgi:Fic family protein
LREYRSKELQIVNGQVWNEVVHYVGPPAANVHVEMDAFFAWFSKTTPTPSGMISTTGISRAAIALLRLESIYPFVECNGRIGRALVAMAIAQEIGSDLLPLSLSHQILNQRDDYQNTLNQARNGSMDASDWVQWFAHAIQCACGESIRLLETRDRETANFWVAQSQSKLNARQRKVLQVLLDHGDAGLPGGLNAAVYRQITAASKPTATRDLSDLVDQGLLIPSGQRKALRYALRTDGCQDRPSTRP